MKDSSCNDISVTPNDLKRKLSQQMCRFLPDKNNRFGYLTLEHSGIRFRACPYGTEFSARQCGCTWIQFTAYQNPRKEVCKPDFKMNFDTNSFRELSGSNMAFYVENAVTQNGAAKFRGNGKITIWGFMNKELGHDFAVRIRFKPFNTEGGYGMLVSNCGHEGLPTVEISMQDKKARLIAKSMHSSSPSVLEYHIVPYEWNEISYHYNGNTFTAEINGNSISEQLIGGLETSPNPMFIGGCPKPGSGFNGLIDNVEIYSTCVPSNFLQ